MGKDLVVSNQTYAITKPESNVSDIIKANIGDGGISQFDLDTIKVPGGGGKFFTIPDLDGDKSLDSFEGIIVYWRESRAYWPDDKAEKPQCSSRDSVRGYGDPGGDGRLCSECPLSKWGSAPGDSKGQACTLKRHLFIVQENDLLPVRLSLPPTSLQRIRAYFMRLAGKGSMYNAVVTYFELEVKKGGVQDYSVVVPKVSRVLTPEEATVISSYTETIRPVLEEAPMILEDDLEPADDPEFM